MGKEEIQELIGEAFAVRERAYAPYSGYYVGAALLTKAGRIYLGCNIENASYGATNCGERTAFFQAVQEGERSFRAIVIVGGKREEGLEDCQVSDYAYPCGICRQVMQEFCDADFKIIVARSLSDYRVYTLGELLPFGFGGEHLS